MPLSVFTIESIALILVIAKGSGTIVRKTGSPFVQFISREISQVTNSLTFSTRNSILETRDSILETRYYRGSSLKARGSRDCQLTFERYCILHVAIKCQVKFTVAQFIICYNHPLVYYWALWKKIGKSPSLQYTCIYIENDWWNAKICNFSIAVTKINLIKSLWPPTCK